MRHEIRDSNSLHFTMEVVIGGTPVAGLSPSIRIFSVKNSEYWNFSLNQWDTYDPASAGDSTGTMSALDTDMPGVYEFDATTATMVNTPFDGASPSSGTNDSADAGYVIRMEETTSGLLEYIYVVVNDVMTSSATVSGTIDANVIEWLGTTALGTGGIPNVNVVSSITVDANVTEWLSTVVSAGTLGLPNVNVADWGDVEGASPGSLTLSVGTGKYPNVDAASGGTVDANVVDWNSASAHADGVTITVGDHTRLPQISVKAWWADDYAGTDAHTGTEGYTLGKVSTLVSSTGADVYYVDPDINVSDWGRHGRAANLTYTSPHDSAGYASATLTLGERTNLPQISVKGWWADDYDETNIFTGTEGHTLGQILTIDDGVGGYKHYIQPNINVSDWNGESDLLNIAGGVSTATLSIGDPSGLPQISVTAWSDPDSGRNAIGGLLDGSLSGVSGDTETTWTRDVGPLSSTPINRPNIRTELIADDAIDEGAIEIDAVTYSEISTSAAREISDAVWSADIFKTLYNYDDEDPSPGLPNMQAAPLGSMGHAMIVQYLSQNMNHWNSTGSSPVHTCDLTNNIGRFYSDRLNTTVAWLSAEEIKSYIDRSVIIVKNFDFSATTDTGMMPTGAATDVQVYLGRISAVGEFNVRQYFEIKLVDEDGGLVPGGFTADEDILIIKAETDSTMHEVAHEVWEEEVADHETKHTFGMFNRIIAGLAQYNHRITDSTYDESGRLLACRLVVYPSAEAAEAGDLDGALTIVSVTSEYNEKQNMTTFLSAEEGTDVDPVDPDE